MGEIVPILSLLSLICFVSGRSYEGGDHLKTKVDPDLCIACGLCVSACPDLYSWDDDGKAKAIDGPVPEEQESCAEEAAENCPTDAISTD